MSRWAGVEAVRFDAPADQAPIERDEALRYAGNVQPVDIQIDWASREDADQFFGAASSSPSCTASSVPLP